MKLAWLCYEKNDNFADGYDSTRAIILFFEPHKSIIWIYAKVVPIVYSEILE